MRPDSYCAIGAIEWYCDGCDECQAMRDHRRSCGISLQWAGPAQDTVPCAEPQETLAVWAARMHAAGHKWQEIADVLGCSVSTVCRRVRDISAAAGVAHCGDCQRMLHTETGQPWCAWSWTYLQVDADGKPRRGTICKYKADRSATDAMGQDGPG